MASATKLLLLSISHSERGGTSLNSNIQVLHLLTEN